MKFGQIVIIPCFVCLLMFCSCSKQQLRSSLKRMLKSEIVLPEKIVCIEDGQCSPMPKHIRESAKLIIFVDSTECSKCRIDKLVRYNEIIELSQNTGTFYVVPLLSVTKEEFESMVLHVQMIEQPFPIYFDETNSFRSSNPSIPDDIRFHCMFVDSIGQIKLVGDPLQNDQLKELLYGLVADFTAYAFPIRLNNL